MKIIYDAAVDALSIRFLDSTVTTRHLAEGIAADYDGAGKLSGLEILDAQKRFGGQEALQRISWEGFASADLSLGVHENPPQDYPEK